MAPERAEPGGALASRGLAYLVVFAAAAVGAGLVRTVTTTYLPLLLPLAFAPSPRRAAILTAAAT